MTLKRFAAILIAFIAIVVSSYLIFRGVVLDNAIDKVKSKVFERTGLRLEIGKTYFESFARIGAEDVYLIPTDSDTLFHCNKAAISFSLLRLLKGQPPVNNIILKEGFLFLHEVNDSVANYNALLRNKSSSNEATDSSNNGMNYRELASALWKRGFDLADFNFVLSDFQVRWKSPAYFEKVDISKFSLQKTKLVAEVSDSIAGTLSSWLIDGVVDPNKEVLTLNGKAASGKPVQVPFFEKLSGIKYRLTSFDLQVNGIDDDNGNFMAGLKASAISPSINHWRISPEDVQLDSLRMAMTIMIDDTSIACLPQSVITVNRLPIETGICFSRNPDSRIILNVNIPSVDANTFFNSLPKGLFETLEGIQVSGKLSYHLKFDANLQHPDQLIFDSEMKKDKFRIYRFGNENFAAINGPFSYPARDRDRIVRILPVGPENPSYVPLQEISPLLVNAVLTAEDGTFRFHRGFNEEAFRQSIATNIRERRFARGGSTITMQLVKNVFLNRNKTISRKLEEAIIVWLIENTGLVSKDRMLEVYLNIIEWGPNVYGIGEASEFYFSKHPSQLSLEESIYLSSIIPNPKAFKWSFDKQGSLREYLQGYFKLVAGRMAKKEIITPEQLEQMQFKVELKGPALQFVLPVDTIPVDSLPADDNTLLFENL
jgi:hypothetical protein